MHICLFLLHSVKMFRFLVWEAITQKSSFSIGAGNVCGGNTEMNTEMGWYILGEAQEHIGPYALSELRGKPSIPSTYFLLLIWISRSEWLELFWMPHNHVCFSNLINS